MNMDRNFRRLSIYFGLFATIAAGLIGLGQGSWSLPLLVGTLCIISTIYTDTLGWFSLHRYLVYVGMIFGAGLAIFEFMSDPEAQPLPAVGNLLVYVQIPLFFQKKTKRVFEQWGVFLLLELVVAALVNDNALYGVLMLPVLAIGCAALMALAQYASHLRHNESISESTSFFARWIHWLGKEKLVTRRSSGITLSANGQSHNENETKSRSFAAARWDCSILPTAFSILLFSVAYFFMLPRLSSGTYEGVGFNSDKIGFSERISLGQIGQLLQNDTPVFRMELRDPKTGGDYILKQPPYIRGTVVHSYISGKERGFWQRSETGYISGFKGNRVLPVQADFEQTLAKSADAVDVTITERVHLPEIVPSIPPFAQSRSGIGLLSIRRDWRMVDTFDSLQRIEHAKKRKYIYTTYCFTQGEESALLPDMNDCIVDPDGREPTESSLRYYGKRELVDFPVGLEILLPFRDKVIEKNAHLVSDKVSQALMFEDYFAESGDFQYSLNMAAPIDNEIDPVADFILNKKSGHCQYFATALALILRSMEIPTRLVVGFRPGEYNAVGKYFLVQQNHAHVWVEAYFTREELEARSLAVPNWIKRGAWLRLDPTPTGEGSNAGGTFRESNGQTLGVMQDLWTEMVMNMDKSRQSSIFSMFGESSGGSYMKLWMQIQAIVARMRSSQFIGGFLSIDRWFSWRFSVGFILAASALLAIYRSLIILFPNSVPRLRWKSRAIRPNVSSIGFYNRIVKHLKSLGLQRQSSQTQREFLLQASSQLQASGVSFDAELLADTYYEQRFGGLERLDTCLQEKVDESLKRLEAISPESVRTRTKNLKDLNAE